MKRLLIYLVLFMIDFVAFGQDNIFSIGYGKTYVGDDSTSFNVLIDLNRTPGVSESAGGFYFVNRPFKGSKWGYYFKPTMDINVGTSIASSPNNISLGLMNGFAYDFEKTSLGVFTFLCEMGPEFVSSRDLKKSLTYFSFSPLIDYEIWQNGGFHAIIGASIANGFRANPEQDKAYYGRLTFPLFIKGELIKASAKVEGNDMEFKVIKISGRFKYNWIFSDKSGDLLHNRLFYNTIKADIYFHPFFGLNLTYNKGFEEPLFKENHSFSIGLTFARKF
ncbi:hypothetical protein BWI93_03190 [Siphonobacter sp. BAB-5385]|uniref:hypothetical protein n=1 Tax=Siphonobacter sp. BAB-5385 TaxID=1864822 RepID=UPI000B9ECECA|nr:hypothetical protein [Siphonobacter sp. BAB-5385]OZI09601.1 hypothetical protein BWI93_03190 [Siphonobacter sp. BAB-5385]